MRLPVGASLKNLPRCVPEHLKRTGITAPSSATAHLRLQDVLGVPLSRHAQPHRPAVAFDREREIEKGAAQALVYDELRYGQQDFPVRGVPEGVALVEFLYLPDVLAQSPVQRPLALLLLGGERRPAAGDRDLAPLWCRFAVHSASSLRFRARRPRLYLLKCTLSQGGGGCSGEH